MMRFVVGAFALVFGAGCGSDALSFCIETAKASCQVQFQCCTAAERTAAFGNVNNQIGPYYDEGGCVDAFTRQCEVAAQVQDESIAAKRLSFDKTKGDKCLDDKRKAAADCDADAIFNRDENCAQLFTGLVADGGKCTSSNECKELGSNCEVDTTQDDGTFVVTIEGTCKGQGDEGEPCFPGGQCKAELRCLQSPVDGSQSCEPPGGAGAVCTSDFDCGDGLRCTEDANFQQRCTAPGDVGASCNSDNDCSAELRCLQNDVSQLVCTVPGVAGSRCNQDADCISGLLCAFSVGGSGETCQAPAGAGDECPGGTAQCLPGLDCRSENTVNRCFAGDSGDPCDFSTTQRCGAGLQCRLEPIAGRNECLAPLALNAPCSEFTAKQCASPLVCRENASFQAVCLQPLAANSLCQQNSNGDDPCDATHHCIFDGTDDTCQPRLIAGSSCSSDQECTANTFCDRFNTGVCIGLKTAGVSCDQTSECAANLTCRNNDVGSDTICRALSSDGEVCAQTADCTAGLDCRLDDDGSRTVCRGLSAENERCDDIADCAAGLDCRSDDDGFFEICRGPSGEHGRCDNALDCAVGLECRFDNTTGQQVCLGQAAAGEACAQDTDCVDGLVCRTDPNTFQTVCRALANAGDTCTQDTDCVAGLRCRDLGEADGVLVCTDKQDDGSPCQADEDCVSGSCDTADGFCGEAPPDQNFEFCNGI